MSDDGTIVARELQDLTQSVDGLSRAIRENVPTVTVNVPDAVPPSIVVEGAVVNVPESAPPVVNMSAPVVNVPAPVVNVAAASVSFDPTINVPAVKPNAYTVRITERDENGLILAFDISPIGSRR